MRPNTAPTPLESALANVYENKQLQTLQNPHLRKTWGGSGFILQPATRQSCFPQMKSASAETDAPKADLIDRVKPAELTRVSACRCDLDACSDLLHRTPAETRRRCRQVPRHRSASTGFRRRPLDEIPRRIVAPAHHRRSSAGARRAECTFAGSALRAEIARR